MYVLKPGTKRDPARRWALPDRIFFGYGACAILAGVYLRHAPPAGFFAERVVPHAGHAGNHIYVTDGQRAFDFHGYACRDRLLAHHRRIWSAHSPGWEAELEVVDFDLLDTAALNARRMLGPDQYLHDPIPRARRFIAGKDPALARSLQDPGHGMR